MRLNFLLLFGGHAGYQFDNDTWLWSNGTWSELSVSSGPVARWGASLAIDSAGCLLLFGGFNASYYWPPTVGTFHNDTWTLCGSGGATGNGTSPGGGNSTGNGTGNSTGNSTGNTTGNSTGTSGGAPSGNATGTTGAPGTSAGTGSSSDRSNGSAPGTSPTRDAPGGGSSNSPDSALPALGGPGSGFTPLIELFGFLGALAALGALLVRRGRVPPAR